MSVGIFGHKKEPPGQLGGVSSIIRKNANHGIVLEVKSIYADDLKLPSTIYTFFR